MLTVALLHEIAIQGCIGGLMLLAVFLCSEIAHKDDLTIEGSFSLGGVAAILACTYHAPLLLVLLAATSAGACLGVLSHMLHTHLGLNSIMSGLCSTASVFSIGLVCVGSYATVPASALLANGPLPVLLQLGCILGATFLFVSWLLSTEVGLCMKASGENGLMVRSLGKSPFVFQSITLGLANGSAGLAGALFVLNTSFFSITGNIGMLVAGISSLMIGGLFTRHLRLPLLLGAFVYQGLFACIISLGINPAWNNLLKALFIIILFSIRTHTRSAQ